MIKAELIAYLSKLPDDEPVFLLRAQDVTAPDVMVDWVLGAERAGCTNQQKLADALQLSVKMREWPNRKVPD